MKKILVGTSKGLVIFGQHKDNVQYQDHHFPGFSINMIFVDPIDGDWWVGVSHKHWGQKLHKTSNEGKTWSEIPVPNYKNRKLPDGRPARLMNIWCMERSEQGYWIGTEPGGLFFSQNRTGFELNASLWEHPSRQTEGQWFGAGKDEPFIHSFVVDPNNTNHLYVAVSCAGIFESTDGGASWNARNKGLLATYLPRNDVEVGHDPHLLLMHPQKTEVLWQQNHCGIYVSKNGGQEWEHVSDENSIPYYGFPIAIDEEDPAKAWVIPAMSDEQRISPNLNMEVYQTNDYGATWQSVSDGLPDHAFDIVLRHGFCKKRDLLAFGTTSGNLYCSSNETIKWSCISNHLTKVNCLEISLREY